MVLLLEDNVQVATGLTQQVEMPWGGGGDDTQQLPGLVRCLTPVSFSPLAWNQNARTGKGYRWTVFKGLDHPDQV